ncbi:hypothetical protein [Micromonospora sp. CA-248212]|uniref:hypothetical protein n=1 Tax=Micromonospora sp. CA-248212 TaxID=3239961 RepID=UPI003D8F7E5A
MNLIRRHPLAAFLASIYAWFGLTAAVSITTAATGGETTGTEAVVIVAVGVISLCGMGASVWLYRRHENRRHDEFMRLLDEPLQPSRLTLWHPPTDHT